MKKHIVQAFHNDPKIKADLVVQLEAHYAADEIIKGTYWENGKGCAVGCCVHGSNHGLFPVHFGIPESIAHLMDGIFEGLPNEQAKKFPLKLINSIPVGADLCDIANLFLEWLLIDPIHGVSRLNSDPCIRAVAALHRRVADGGSVSFEDWAAAGAAPGAAPGEAAGEAAMAAYLQKLIELRAAAMAAQSQKLIELLAAAMAAQSQKLIELLAAAVCPKDDRTTEAIGLSEEIR